MTTARIHTYKAKKTVGSSIGWAVFYLTAAFWIASLLFQFFLPLNSIYGEGLVLLDVSEGFIDGFGFLTFTLVGALLLAQGQNLGIAYLIPGLAYNLGWFLTNYSIYGLHVSPLPAFVLFGLSGNVSFLIAIGVTLIIIPLLYPTGRPWSRLGFFLFWLANITIVTGILVVAITPGPVNEPLFTTANPLGVEGAESILEMIMGIDLIFLVVLILAAALSVILRLRKAEPETKKKYWYLLLGELVLILVFLSDSFIQPIFPLWGPIAPLIAIPTIPLATYLALIQGRKV